MTTCRATDEDIIGAAVRRERKGGEIGFLGIEEKGERLSIFTFAYFHIFTFSHFASGRFLSS